MNAAKKSYQAYVAAVGGTTFDDRPLPTFEELGERQKLGWKAAADCCGTSFTVGMEVVSNTGVDGIVSNLSIGKSGLRGAWIDGVDSTGRPFESYFYEHELSGKA